MSASQWFTCQKNQSAQLHESSPENVHSLENQSLGVVSANLKKIMMGRYWNDPRRMLQLSAIWLEIPTFAFVILGSTLGDLQKSIQGRESFEEGTIMTILNTYRISVLVIGIFGLIAAVLLNYAKNTQLRNFQQLILFPLIFDVGFISISAGGIRLVTCQPGMDMWVETPDSCKYFNFHQVMYVVVGLAVFFCL